ncbi:MAG: hypothetical protein JWP87_1372 [Labilithrix sp.]|nr:hypothetical protein [Labilithrix sp.]
MASDADDAKARLDAALEKASDELGLESYYRDCVRPLLGQPREQWPTCCGGTCEPCSQILVLVADRVQTLLGQK